MKNQVKSIIIGITGTVMFFFILVVVFSGAIIFYGGEEELAGLRDAEAIPMVPEIELQMITQARDSLKAEIEYLQALAASRAAKIDSLGEQIGLKDATISAFEDRVQGKDAEIAVLRDVGMNAKHMARTFATMSVDELSPIVARLSDQVVQDIYRQTANKRRKFLLTALGDERAAAMTNRFVTEKGS